VEEEPGNSTRRIAAMEKVSQNTVMEILNSYCILTVFSGFKALPLLGILEERLSADGFFKRLYNCSTSSS
jgi:hypothetical protein